MKNNYFIILNFKKKNIKNIKTNIKNKFYNKKI